MPLFITTSDAFSTSTCELPPEEAHHALHVLRLKKGDEIQLTDGAGIFATATLQPEGKKIARAHIQSVWKMPPRQPRISIYLGMLKTRQRLETALEKLTEIGITDIILMDTEHTERQKFRMDRARGIITSAVKQSQSAWMPGLHHSSFGQAVEHVAAQDAAHHLLIAAHEKQHIILNDGSSLQGRRFTDIRQQLHQDYSHALADSDKPLSLHIFIGPEGGFSPAEVARMLSISQAQPLWLGDVRLRAETAAIQIAGLFRFGL